MSPARIEKPHELYDIIKVVIKKVISGGQIGADIAGLRAAKSFNLETGGWMPKGWRTKLGSMPIFAQTYGLQEMPTTDYQERTYRNVMEADGTIRLAHTFSSPGERCTLAAIKTYMKPSYDVLITESYTGKQSLVYIRNQEAHVESVVKWIRDQQIKVLNIAGNADIYIEPVVEKFLEEVIQLDALLPAH